MNDKNNTIGLTELLDEISRDLDELKKKNPGDYSMKGIAMYWDMQREKILARHAPTTAVKKFRRVQGFRKMMTWFFAGWVVMLIVQTALRFVLP